MSENVQAFLDSLLSLIPKEIMEEQRKKGDVWKASWFKSDDFEKRRKRIIGLWRVIFSGAQEYGAYSSKLVGEKIWRALTYERDLTHIQAIVFATLFR